MAAFLQPIDVKKTKIKNVENLLSVQANSEISVLHLSNDRLNCSGLLLLSTIFVACWAYYIRVGI